VSASDCLLIVSILGIYYVCVPLYVRLASVFLCWVRVVSGDALAAIGLAFPGGSPYLDVYSGLRSTAGLFVPTLEASFSEYATPEYDRDIPSRKWH